VRWMQAEEGSQELEEARDGLLAASDREGAAEAALMLADIAWRQGQRDSMRVHLDDARSLVAETPPSRIQASVLSEVARYDMIADRNESAVEVGRQALEMADQLGLDDLRAHALNSIGAARGLSGDPEGLVDLEDSIAIAARSNSISDLLRGHNNLAATTFVLGDLERAHAEALETKRLAEHFGHYVYARFVEGGALIWDLYRTGHWDEGLARADAFLDEVAGGSPHYQAGAVYGFRGLIRLARADPGAESDADQAVESARLAKDPQILQTSLGLAGLIFLSAGNKKRAGETVDEALAGLRELQQLGFAAVFSHALAWVAWMLGRGAEVLDVLRRDPSESPWLQAGRAVAAGDLRGAADIFGGFSGGAYEAFYRLRAAEQLVDEGRRAEADDQLAPALAFYRSVGATRYVREGEALLAASA
jgi:hypothetical protein